MNAGKSTGLVQVAFNYGERGMDVDVYKSIIDTREKTFVVRSRAGLETPAIPVYPQTSFIDIYESRKDQLPACILIDEAQFLAVEQIYQLREVVDRFGVPVICYGLRTDFKRELFPASGVLLGIADVLEEIYSICFCGSRARFVLRIDNEGNPIKDGPQVLVGGNESYAAVCSKHWMLGKYAKE